MPNKISSEISLLLDMLDQAYDKRAWHGTNLLGSLRGLKPDMLLWRPGPKRHNIWEIALHAAYWKYAVYRRITQADKGSFPRNPSDWPTLPVKTDNKTWQADLSLLKKYHKQLREAIHNLPAAKLNKKMPESKMLYKQVIYGIASHDLYHAGQIQLLKRLYKNR